MSGYIRCTNSQKCKKIAAYKVLYLRETKGGKGEGNFAEVLLFIGFYSTDQLYNIYFTIHFYRTICFGFANIVELF